MVCKLQNFTRFGIFKMYLTFYLIRLDVRRRKAVTVYIFTACRYLQNTKEYRKNGSIVNLMSWVHYFTIIFKFKLTLVNLTTTLLKFSYFKPFRGNVPFLAPDAPDPSGKKQELQLTSYQKQSVIRRKIESQNGCFKKAKHAKFSEKAKISYPLIRTEMCAYQGVKNPCFSENLACFAFLKHPF